MNKNTKEKKAPKESEQKERNDAQLAWLRQKNIDEDYEVLENSLEDIYQSFE